MNESEKTIAILQDEINILKRETKDKINELEFEILKLKHPDLNDFLVHFEMSCVHFIDKLSGKQQLLLEHGFGVKLFEIPVEVRYIDNYHILIEGLRENVDIDKKELYDKLYKLTNNVFPLKANVKKTYCHLGEEIIYGDVQNNILGITTVYLVYNKEAINTIRIYHKSDKYKKGKKENIYI